MEQQCLGSNTAAKSDLAKIDFDLDLDIDVATIGLDPRSQDYENEALAFIEQQEKMLNIMHCCNVQNGQEKGKLTETEKEGIRAILKSQTEEDIMTICGDILDRNPDLYGRELLAVVYNFLNEIGLLGSSQVLEKLQVNFDRFFGVIDARYGVTLGNARENLPIFVKGFQEYILNFH